MTKLRAAPVAVKLVQPVGEAVGAALVRFFDAVRASADERLLVEAAVGERRAATLVEVWEQARPTS